MTETPKAAAAFHEYCILGPGRSLVKLAESNQSFAKSVPVLKRWSSLYNWQERSRQYDVEQAAAIDQEIAEEKARILKQGYALMHKRVELIQRKIAQLDELTSNEETIWLPDVKSVGTGPNAQRVDLVQFNDAAFRELREYLTDMADELGERVKTTKQEVSGSIDVAGAKDLLMQRLAQLEQSHDKE